MINFTWDTLYIFFLSYTLSPGQYQSHIFSNNCFGKSSFSVHCARFESDCNFVEANTAYSVRDAFSFRAQRSFHLSNVYGADESVTDEASLENWITSPWQPRFSLSRVEKSSATGKTCSLSSQESEYTWHVWLVNSNTTFSARKSTFSMVVERIYGSRFAGYCASGIATR